MARPDLNDQLSSDTFRQYYYLKAELTAFCREQGLPTSGGKLELTERVAHYLATGQTLKASPRKASEKAAAPLSENTKIEPNFRCTERHRQFFTTQIGPGSVSYTHLYNAAGKDIFFNPSVAGVLLEGADKVEEEQALILSLIHI